MHLATIASVACNFLLVLHRRKVINKQCSKRATYILCFESSPPLINTYGLLLLVILPKRSHYSYRQSHQLNCRPSLTPRYRKQSGIETARVQCRGRQLCPIKSKVSKFFLQVLQSCKSVVDNLLGSVNTTPIASGGEQADDPMFLPAWTSICCLGWDYQSSAEGHPNCYGILVGCIAIFDIMQFLVLRIVTAVIAIEAICRGVLMFRALLVA